MSVFNVNHYTIPDYNSKNFYGLSPVEKIYNTILIPIDDYPEFNAITIGSKINIIYKDNKIPQSVITEPYLCKIYGINYLKISIATGVRLQGLLPFVYDKYSMEYKSNSYKTSLIFDKSRQCKLLIGSLILSDNYFFAFNSGDTIQIFIDNESEIGNIFTVNNYYNYYLPLKYTTVLDLNPSYNTESLSFLNSYSNNIQNLKVRSLTTKPNMTKGSLRLDIKGVTGNRYKVLIANKTSNYSDLFYTDNLLEIDNLTEGSYFVRINDQDNDRPYRINGQLNNQHIFQIDILGSIEEESEILKNQFIQKGLINQASLKQMLPLTKIKMI